MADFSKLVAHPEYDEIVSKLLTGVSPKAIADWLKQKYPGAGNAHLHLPAKLFKDFLNSGYVNFKDQIRKDLEEVKKGNKADHRLSKSLIENKTYRETLEKYAKEELDFKKEISKIVYIVRDRVEQIYDKVQQNPEYVGNNDRILKDWLSMLSDTIMKLETIENRKNEGINIQNNYYNVQVVQQHFSVFQEAVCNVIRRFDPELALEFMQQLDQELLRLNPAKPEKEFSLAEKNEKLDLIEAQIVGKLDSIPSP